MEYQVSFGRGQWNPEDWQEVRSPRWVDMSHWEQQEDCIANHIPADLKPEDMQMGRDRTGETYISMLLKRPVHGSCRLSTTCSFGGRMAPLLVFSRELGPVHHEHLEVVLYDRGINLWHHFFEDGKPSWKLLSYMDLDLRAGELHRLTAELLFKHKGVFLNMGCGERTFGCRIAEGWPQDYFVGFTACEGRNTFYDFSLELGEQASAVMAERVSD